MANKFNKSAFYSSVLEFVKVIVLKRNEKLVHYFLIPNEHENLNTYAKDIAYNWEKFVPSKEFVINGIKELQKDGKLYSITVDSIQYDFELIDGKSFDEMHVKIEKNIRNEIYDDFEKTFNTKTRIYDIGGSFTYESMNGIKPVLRKAEFSYINGLHIDWNKSEIVIPPSFNNPVGPAKISMDGGD